MSVLVPLSRGKYAIVSNVDAPRVLAHKWSCHDGKYAGRMMRVTLPSGRTVRRKVLLHRFIMNAAPDVEIDHCNGDGFDCRRQNLRVATRPQNVANTGPRKGSVSRFKGVSFRRDRGTWRAEITIDGRKRDLGTYKSEHEAALAYNEAALEAWGEFAYLNPVPVHADSIPTT